MQYSFMSFSTPTLTLAEMLQAAQRYGYDGIEPRLDSKHAHGIEVDTIGRQRMALRKQIDASGIKLSCLATSLSYANPENTDDMIRQTHARIDLAGDFAVPAIRVFGGLIPPGVSREMAISLLVEALRKVADHAGERQVEVCLETHDDWCDPEHIATVLRQVDHPAVGANWDIMHPVRAKKADMAGSFEKLKPWIRHVHIHDGVGKENLKFVPIGIGDIDHRCALQLLMSANYCGFISGEWINWESYDIHLPRELTTMKQYEKAVQ